MAGEPAGHSRNITHNDSRKERHLVGKARIDRWFSGAGHGGDLVDAGAREPAFDEGAAGCVENALVDLASELPPGPPAAHRLPFLQRLFPYCNPAHRFSSLALAGPALPGVEQ